MANPDHGRSSVPGSTPKPGHISKRTLTKLAKNRTHALIIGPPGSWAKQVGRELVQGLLATGGKAVEIIEGELQPSYHEIHDPGFQVVPIDDHDAIIPARAMIYRDLSCDMQPLTPGNSWLTLARDFAKAGHAVITTANWGLHRPELLDCFLPYASIIWQLDTVPPWAILTRLTGEKTTMFVQITFPGLPIALQPPPAEHPNPRRGPAPLF